MLKYEMAAPRAVNTARRVRSLLMSPNLREEGGLNCIRYLSDNVAHFRYVYPEKNKKKLSEIDSQTAVWKNTAYRHREG
jgi:hypothetical protein